MRKIIILGSTGSIGQQTIDVCQRYPELFKIIGLSTNRQTDLLKEQIKKTDPVAVAVGDSALMADLTAALTGTEVAVYSGLDGLLSLCQLDEADTIVNALVGSIGLRPTLASLERWKNLCLSNKESLVVGGELVTSLAQKRRIPLVPIDSEHSAIFQCLQGEKISQVEKIIITGSGGPFRGKKKRNLKNVTVEEALAHPRWKMGKKITIDSATLMNKGLEIIEAHFLFRLPYEAIEVVIHPESTVHSLVQFKDGSIVAQLAPPDMRLPIQYALTYPKRMPSPVEAANLVDIGSLHFEQPDLETFPCLKYSYEAAKAGKTYPAVLNAANEEAVAAFLQERIGFLDIAEVIYQTLENHQPLDAVDLSALEEAEKWARKKASTLIDQIEEGRR